MRFHRWGRGPLCVPNMYLQFGAASELRVKFHTNKTGCPPHPPPLPHPTPISTHTHPSSVLLAIITKTRPFKYIENFTTKNWKFSDKNYDNFHISAQNINCVYSLEPLRRGGSNESPQFMLLSRNKKNDVYPVNPSFNLCKWGFLDQNYIGMFLWCFHCVSVVSYVAYFFSHYLFLISPSFSSIFFTYIS